MLVIFIYINNQNSKWIYLSYDFDNDFGIHDIIHFAGFTYDITFEEFTREIQYY